MRRKLVAPVPWRRRGRLSFVHEHGQTAVLTGKGMRRHDASAGLVGKAAILIVVAGLCSCLGTYYVRTWSFEGVDCTDTLYLSGDTFRLERDSSNGTASFSGRIRVKGEEWRFEIDTWQPADALPVQFDPPVVYVYRGRSFENGLAFYSYRVIGRSPLPLFIRAPSDFDIRD
jgi:hypothetical protein